MTPSQAMESQAWGQVVYTSSDTGAAAGGWGVKRASPGLTTADITVLTNGVTTRLTDRIPLDKHPLVDELESRTRRLAACEHDGRLALWHSVSAGPDATGRPGNVFTHAALDLASVSTLRPIVLWRSADWLTPFGPSEVGAAELPTSLRPGQAVTSASVLDFLLEGDAPKLVHLEWLLDVAAHVRETRSRMVLLTDSDDESAMWIAAISFMTSPRLARQLGFVTFERADGLADTALTDFKLICVPREDAVSLERISGSTGCDVVVVDPLWELEIEDDSIHWRLPTGVIVPTTGWRSRVFDLVALTRPHAARVLDGQVAWDAAMENAERVPLHWPLAMSLLVDDHTTLGNRIGLVMECLREAPTTVVHTPNVLALVEEVVEVLSEDALAEFAAGRPDLLPLINAVKPWDSYPLTTRAQPTSPGDDHRAVLLAETSPAPADAPADDRFREPVSRGHLAEDLLAELVVSIRQEPLGSIEPRAFAHSICVVLGYATIYDVPAEDVGAHVALAAAWVEDMGYTDRRCLVRMEAFPRAWDALRAADMPHLLSRAELLRTRLGVTAECFDHLDALDVLTIKDAIGSITRDWQKHVESVASMVVAWPEADRLDFIRAALSADRDRSEQFLGCTKDGVQFGDASVRALVHLLPPSEREQRASHIDSQSSWRSKSPDDKEIRERLTALQSAARTTTPKEDR